MTELELLLPTIGSYADPLVRMDDALVLLKAKDALLEAKDAEIAALLGILTRLCINGNRTSGQIAEDWKEARKAIAQAVQPEVRFGTQEQRMELLRAATGQTEPQLFSLSASPLP